MGMIYRLNERYALTEGITCSSYIGTDLHTGGRIVAKLFRGENADALLRNTDRILTGAGTTRRLGSWGRWCEDGASALEAQRRQFLYSARLLEGLNGMSGVPRFVELTEVELDGEGQIPCLIMEYVEGTTLGELMKQGELPWSRISGIFCSLLDTLSELHRRGILHLDIHPWNIVIRPDGTPILIDLGSAQETENGVAWPLTVCGSYSAPEQRWQADVGTDADTYSLGIILLQLVAGVDKDRAEVSEGCSALRMLWLRAASPDPARRFRSAEEMKAALSDIGEEAYRACRAELELLRELKELPKRHRVFRVRTRPVGAEEDPLGFVIGFGSYPMHLPYPTTIEWYCFPEAGGRMLLASCESIHVPCADGASSEEAVQRWLNEAFLETAFTGIQRGLILRERPTMQGCIYPFRMEGDDGEPTFRSRIIAELDSFIAEAYCSESASRSSTESDPHGFVKVRPALSINGLEAMRLGEAVKLGTIFWNPCLGGADVI